MALGGNPQGEATPVSGRFGSVPLLRVENGLRLQHTVHVRDSLKGGRGRPPEALRTALYVQLLPPGEEAATDIALYTRAGHYEDARQLPRRQGQPDRALCGGL